MAAVFPWDTVPTATRLKAPEVEYFDEEEMKWFPYEFPTPDIASATARAHLFHKQGIPARVNGVRYEPLEVEGVARKIEWCRLCGRAEKEGTCLL